MRTFLIACVLLCSGVQAYSQYDGLDRYLKIKTVTLGVQVSSVMYSEDSHYSFGQRVMLGGIGVVIGHQTKDVFSSMELAYVEYPYKGANEYVRIGYNFSYAAIDVSDNVSIVGEVGVSFSINISAQRQPIGSYTLGAGARLKIGPGTLQPVLRYDANSYTDNYANVVIRYVMPISI